MDGFVKSPSAALRGNFAAAVPEEQSSQRPHSSVFARLVPPWRESFLRNHRFVDFLRDHQDYLYGKIKMRKGASQASPLEEGLRSVSIIIKG
jgi:hypothetical protein